MKFSVPQPSSGSNNRPSGYGPAQLAWLLERRFNPATSRGIALVVTLILLSVITFMAIAFLVLSRGQANQTAQTTEQTTARLAADAALEHLKARLEAIILATTNEFAVDLMVSTNYINPRGFDPGIFGPGNYTNVNYDYTSTGVPWNQAYQLVNLGNLFLDPRVPVYITNRLYANSNDFRYYIDVNRNNAFDLSGIAPVISADPNNPYYNTNGLTMPTAIPGATLSNLFTGDPQFIGILERPGFPHGPDNRFVARFAYIAIPVSRTLDLNYIHNQAKRLGGQTEAFFRNEGAGSWEINLAAFLVDLNTNLWPYPNASTMFPAYTKYQYNLSLAQSSQGAAFDDALSLLLYRYGPPNPRGYLNLRSVQQDYGALGVNAFTSDGIDYYSAGPLMTGTSLPQDLDQPDKPWVGSDNPNKYFNSQELFNPANVPGGFNNKIYIAGTNVDSYNRTTYFRMLSQLSTESVPEPPGKIHLNYANVGGLSPTNFVPWDSPQMQTIFGRPGSEVFFTNAVDRMLRSAGFNFGVTNIPVFTNGQFVFTPSIRRVLQLAANIFDATTNRTFAGSADPYPTIFRPVFSRGPLNSIVISDFKEVKDFNELNALGPLTNAYGAAVTPGFNQDYRIFGVPFVVGARKGLPNFNEISMESVSTITRKLIVRRPSVGAAKNTWTTNITYLLGISNIVGVEAWNSYTNPYPRAIDIYATVLETLSIGTNVVPTTGPANLTLPRLDANLFGSITIPAGNQWPGYIGPGGPPNTSDSLSFQVPLITNVLFIAPDAVAIRDSGNGMWNFRTNRNIFYETDTNNFPSPDWTFSVTNRFQFIMVDHDSQRLLDYVLLDGMDNSRFLSGELFGLPDQSCQSATAVWNTNRLGNRTERDLTAGMLKQINISFGVDPDINLTTSSANCWKDCASPTAQGPAWEVDKFRVFYGLSPLSYPGIPNTNLAIQVPYTPSKRVYQVMSWQANDPLVHYMATDMPNVALSNSLSIALSVPDLSTYPASIRDLNTSYKPWGGNPFKGPDADLYTAWNVGIKDPQVWRSDYWNFPTNKFPNPGWIGRVHRGTPWQTVFLKSSNVGTNILAWQQWTGNYLWVTNHGQYVTNYPGLPGWYQDANYSSPTNDYALLELFTTEVNDNATRGRLNVNQTNLAAWSAVLSGISVLQGDLDGTAYNKAANYTNFITQPAGQDGTSALLSKIVSSINDVRRTNLNFNGNFKNLGDVLATPELTENSPYLVPAGVTMTDELLKFGISDEVYERIPQQILGLLQIDHTPRYVVYAYGQALKPADRSIFTGGGPYFGMCTNYQITAEVATRTVLRIDGAPNNPHVVVEQFNVLPPD